MLPSTFFHPVQQIIILVVYIELTARLSYFITDKTSDFKLQAILTTVAINYYIMLQYESRHLVAEFTKMVGGKCIRPWDRWSHRKFLLDRRV